ncbi:HAE1 family hydrophobic/amphiphilic exporter-1/multidrug efflux pump [Roseimicrobium gellanilyticum]|uniref:HAE1 family hydrophobic/amphiphilic exporter-1/multidrug efflux pump n=1 Tax=Roseimicrobium gellanilyticum TaxID=748857 RepID=A0A366HP09_9BACT|nr:multidrug efflux RND transporter permease subunit [Roseimicrobium gellanilyticum]RBP45236.1 HAE1 family hydrophobic/amphiphilic exporter-1/multidrug efflux pump [Roseimicrobium gellanilyticum]
MAHFFIQRRVFAMVLSILIVLVGYLGLRSLPIARYPNMTPPTIQVTATYPGASSKVVEETVTTPLEQEINGAEDMIYMSSSSTSDGQCSIKVTFKVGKNIDDAAVDVQNRVARAQPKLPADVTKNGITVTKQSPDMLLVFALSSPDGTYDDLFLNNYAFLNLQSELARVQGVGAVQIFTQKDYSMRVWLQPDKLAKLGLTANDVSRALQEQNVQAAAGQIGSPPAAKGAEFQFSVNVKGRLVDPEEFGDIVILTLQDGTVVRIRDVARTELGGKDYTSFGRINGSPAALIGIFQLPTANALDTANAAKARMDLLAESLPPGMKVAVSFDTTKFVTASIEEVLHTLLEAFVLVVVVVFVFLGNWRATLIPMLAVPVSLIGTFAIFGPLGFSINTLTLFALVLAIGLVVDDAIVVVEAVEHHIEKGLSPLQATQRAMTEVSGPVIAIALVLCSVFVPVSFMGGITGKLYQQFAITLSVSVLISALVALTLTPALCVMLLRHRNPSKGPVGRALAAFNRFFDRVTGTYVSICRRLIRFGIISVVLLAAIYLGAVGLLKRLPTSFLPDEDMGYIFVVTTLPDGASQERTDRVLRKVEDILKQTPGVSDVITIGGLNLLSGARSSNSGACIVSLKDWSERTKPEEQVAHIVPSVYAKVSQIPEAMIIPTSPPPIQGLGNAGGVQFELQDRSGRTPEELQQVADQFLGAVSQKPGIARAFTFYSTRVPQLSVDLDRDKIKTLGIPLDSVFGALQSYLGGLYVNDLTLFGRSFQVKVQAEPSYRMNPEDINNIYVRSADGSMVPFSTFAKVESATGADLLPHYNVYRNAEITASAAPGFSSGQVISTMEQVAKEQLPDGYGYEWTGTALQEKQAGGQQTTILALALLFVFLVLAAQYESWAVPFAVLFGLPIGVFGAFLGAWLRGLTNDVYVQIGLVMLIGLAAKNAILIVEFAKVRRENGMDIEEAALEGAKLRLRPIVMTSLAFILGVVPLVLSSGAGAASRQSLGTAVCFGMTTATVVGVFFIPWLYVVVQRLAEKISGPPKKEPTGMEIEAATAANA